MKQKLVFEIVQKARPTEPNGPEAAMLSSCCKGSWSRMACACFVVVVLTLGFSAHHVWAVGQDGQTPVGSLEQIRKQADEGNADSQYKLAKMYEEGLGVQQDTKEAAKWYLKAAEKGNAQAQYKMGTLYTLGKGVPKDRLEAAKWFGKAAQQGYEPVKQQIQETGTKLKDQLLKNPVGLLQRKLGG
jgi:hypothetical protein